MVGLPLQKRISRICGWRKQTVERSFAEAKVNHGLCDARMLGIRNMRKQCFLTAAVQNVKRLVAPLLFPQTPASSAITYVKKRPFAHPRRNPGLQFMAAEVVFHPAAAHRSRRSLVARDFLFHYEIAGPGILPLCKFCKPFARTLSAPPISMGRNPTGLQNQFKGFRPQ